MYTFNWCPINPSMGFCLIELAAIKCTWNFVADAEKDWLEWLEIWCMQSMVHIALYEWAGIVVVEPQWW